MQCCTIHKFATVYYFIFLPYRDKYQAFDTMTQIFTPLKQARVLTSQKNRYGFIISYMYSIIVSVLFEVIYIYQIYYHYILVMHYKMQINFQDSYASLNPKITTISQNSSTMCHFRSV